MFILYPLYLIEQFLAVIVIPLSLSKSPLSITQSTTCSLSLNTPFCLSSASTKVLLPASTWATTAKLIILSIITSPFGTYK